MCSTGSAKSWASRAASAPPTAGFPWMQLNRCVGACGLAPVLTVNEDVYGKVTVDDVETILAKYQ